MKKILTYLSCFLLSSCSLITINAIQQDANSVRVFEDYSSVEDCQFIHEVIGTEGHWYNYLFISNRDLTQGALNDLKNRARALGGNAVHVHTNMFFSTSVTMLGQAYSCSNE